MRKNLTVALLMVLLVGTAAQQETDPVKFVLDVNRAVSAAREAYRAALEEVGTAGVMPDLIVEGTFFTAPIETRNGPMEAQFMLGQRIPLWGKLSREKKIAVLKAEAAALSLRSVEINTVYALNMNRARYRRIQNSLVILRQYQTDLQSSRTVALTQYSTGMGATQHPVLKLQIEMSMIESRINSLESQLETVVSELQALFDGRFSDRLLGDELMGNFSRLSKESWLETARLNNPGYLLAGNRREVATIRSELARRQNYPDLVAGINYTAIGEEGVTESATAAGSDALGVKVGLNIPLWFGRNKARSQSAKIAVKVTEEEMAQTWNEVKGNLTAIIRESEEIQKTYHLFEETLLKESEQMISSAMSAYETGKISFLDLLDSQRMVVNVRLDFEETTAKREIARAKLLKIAGLIRFEEE
ncbi:MAG: TolC family protein [Candidatus Marinimicrobia bacterium]|jgi:outer membrane protein TolC|nr:hypothetical protein [Candidatus Neomarinimicrobiota bacterium]MDP6593537.1 TolC family protein [Candidatus Neomarinimicrobiota bacterium]